jgi:hypothetical protein
MVRSALKVYFGPEEQTQALAASAPAVETVTVQLSDVVHMLADAVNSNRTWLNDFADDPITLTADLYEVLFAYQHFRRPSA